ncbi:uncharacterized protein MYCFIDRAFT_207526 [Pseudocercospora fijiensis CIRAD86]|uniref:Uncharacterized protein n=1 Tax=Pseudocercospora fijiensis (strain CIRAD86) TaxID=383855 RepID=M3AZE5_PSEFD|nr:uncharacterized protein MYCFIDRAFT_207526 [Pseudocercospora fijiensis CIRAD86]EME82548.1 hypothetical protein MYCFIDRAFT_207526 [Pseudocercospora fijiensis CIRAD86]
MPHTIPARTINDDYIILNDPATIDSDELQPQLQPSRLTQPVFANLRLGYLAGQGNAKDGCPSRIDWKTDDINAKVGLRLSEWRADQLRRQWTQHSRSHFWDWQHKQNMPMFGLADADKAVLEQAVLAVYPHQVPSRPVHTRIPHVAFEDCEKEPTFTSSFLYSGLSTWSFLATPMPQPAPLFLCILYTAQSAMLTNRQPRCLTLAHLATRSEHAASAYGGQLPTPPKAGLKRKRMDPSIAHDETIPCKKTAFNHTLSPSNWVEPPRFSAPVHNAAGNFGLDPSCSEISRSIRIWQACCFSTHRPLCTRAATGPWLYPRKRWNHHSHQPRVLVSLRDPSADSWIFWRAHSVLLAASAPAPAPAPTLLFLSIFALSWTSWLSIPSFFIPLNSRLRLCTQHSKPVYTMLPQGHPRRTINKSPLQTDDFSPSVDQELINEIVWYAADELRPDQGSVSTRHPRQHPCQRLRLQLDREISMTLNWQALLFVAQRWSCHFLTRTLTSAQRRFQVVAVATSFTVPNPSVNTAQSPLICTSSLATEADRDSLDKDYSTESKDEVHRDRRTQSDKPLHRRQKLWVRGFLAHMRRSRDFTPHLVHPDEECAWIIATSWVATVTVLQVIVTVAIARTFDGGVGAFGSSQDLLLDIGQYALLRSPNQPGARVAEATHFGCGAFGIVGPPLLGAHAMKRSHDFAPHPYQEQQHFFLIELSRERFYLPSG